MATLSSALKWRQKSFYVLKTEKQFDLSQTNLVGAVPDRQLGQGGQAGCEDTWNTTVDDQTPVRYVSFVLIGQNIFGFWLADKL